MKCRFVRICSKFRLYGLKWWTVEEDGVIGSEEKNGGHSSVNENITDDKIPLYDKVEEVKDLVAWLTRKEELFSRIL